jgi:nucleoside-diphosphate-sugar epimerase
MKNILVVGGAGYVGGAVTDALMDSSYNVKVYDNLLYEETYRKPVEFIYGDVRHTESLLPLLQEADAVIWLAAIVGDGACALNPDLTIAVNQESVRWLSEHYDGKIVFTSTCSVYGAQDKELDELSPTNPLSLYAATKLEAERFLEKKNAVVFRLGTLFGVGDLFSRIRMDLVVNTLTVKAYTLGRISVFGGQQFRPLLHVKDAARAVLRGTQTESRGVFNLAGQNVRIIDLANQIHSHFPGLIIEKTEMHFQDARNYQVTTKKAEDLLRFEPKYSIDDGIEEVKYLVETGRIKNLDSSRYSNHQFLKESQLPTV